VLLAKRSKEASIESASGAGLTYVSGNEPGISRHPYRNGFRYRNSKGKLIRSTAVLRRIQSLVIPPNWKGVWICSNPNGHLQATGRDGRNRKQYIYHPGYRAVREQALPRPARLRVVSVHR
jgi:DNA topoisomerase-1